MLVVEGKVVLQGGGGLEVEFDMDQDLVDQVFTYAAMMEDKIQWYDYDTPSDEKELIDVLTQWMEHDGFDPQTTKIEVRKEGKGKAQKSFVCLSSGDEAIPLRTFKKDEEKAVAVAVARLSVVLNQFMIPKDERIWYDRATGVLHFGYLATFHRDIWAQVDLGDPSAAAAKALEWAKTFGCEYSYYVGGRYEIDHAIAVAEREGAWEED